MEQLYPLKFKPLLKERIWGGNKLGSKLGKSLPGNGKYGESWEISAVQGEVSIVQNGFLAGNNLQEIIEVYMGDLVGEAVYDRFGIEFPLLIKFIDAAEPLSVQVHPDDKLAAERHHSFGKTEMWYVLHADRGAELISGFREPVNSEVFTRHLKNKSLPSILNAEKVDPGDVFYIPAGRVHAIGAGILVAEIQQTSDITYRIYDWDRTDPTGKSRALHTDLALDCIDYSVVEGTAKTFYERMSNQTVPLISNSYFSTRVLSFDNPIEKDYYSLDSFVIYICLRGEFTLQYQGGTERVETGETLLLPAVLSQYTLIPHKASSILEVYVPSPV